MNLFSLSVLFCLLVAFVYAKDEEPAPFQGLASQKDIDMFKEAKFANEDAVAISVGFYNETRSPYPKNYKGYNVDIDYSVNCYVVFLDADKTEYNMIEGSTEPEGEFGVYMTHTGPCGVCSNLQDLAVYLEQPDLTTPVTRCAKMLIPKNKKKCLRDIGFSERCMYIWYYNTIYTRNGCFNICIRYQKKARNQPEGNYNPCKPISTILPVAEDDPDIEAEEVNENADPLTALEDEVQEKDEQDGLQTTAKGKQTKRPTMAGRLLQGIANKAGSSFKKKNKKVGCRNSINQQPACKEWQWQNGPQRLNPCLQCDECKSGPMFQKVSGRQRRNSGIQSGIGRPIFGEYDHHYFTGEG